MADRIIFRQTTLKRFLRCPYQYYLQNIKGVRIPMPSYVFLGGTIHLPLAENAMQKVKTREDMALSDILDLFSDAFDSRQFLLNAEESEMPTGIIWEEPEGQTKDVGILLLKEYHSRIAPSVQPIEVEFEVRREFPTFDLTARLDFIDENGFIGDWKSARRNKTQVEVDSDLQPTVYAAVLDSAIDFQFHMMVKAKVPYTTIWKCKRTLEDALWLTEMLLPPIIKMVEAGLFPMTDPANWYCSKEYCQLWNWCRGRKQFAGGFDSTLTQTGGARSGREGEA